MRPTSSPGRFSLALVGERYLQSQGKAPWGQGCDEQGKAAQVVHVGLDSVAGAKKGRGREGEKKRESPFPSLPNPLSLFSLLSCCRAVTAITPVWCHPRSSQSIKIGTIYQSINR